MDRKCFICGRTSNLERHHIFGASNRKKSEKYGLVVDLCHNCHNEPPMGVHHNQYTMLFLHQYGQERAMREQGWTVDEFRNEFGKNYL
mgnify:CR=1 FL=1